MSNAFDTLDEHSPSPLWSQYREIDFQEDLRQATGRISEIVDDDPPPAGLTAVSFLLYEVSDATMSPFATASVIELSGATTYPAEDWRFGPTRAMWYPDAYLPTPGLASLAAAAARADEAADGKSGGAYAIATYDLAFAHSLGLSADVMRGSAGRLLLGGRERLGVASGFHDGDTVLLGELTASGLDMGSFGWC